MKENDTVKNIKMDDKSKTQGNSRITRVFNELGSGGDKAFIPFLTCGFPDMEGFYKLFGVLEDEGADIIEVGLPFSDPLADGPVIQATSKAALEYGVNSDMLFDCLGHLRKRTSTPIAILAYFNNVYVYGVEKFLSRVDGVGADGVIIPDLPLNEYEKYRKFFKHSGVDNIMIASLTTETARLKSIADMAKGFLYCVSLKGVTGVRRTVSPEVKSFLGNLRKITNLPLALGFGLSNRQQIGGIMPYCDGVIIGSKILSLVLEADGFKTGLDQVRRFASEINAVLKS